MTRVYAITHWPFGRYDLRLTDFVEVEVKPVPGSLTPEAPEALAAWKLTAGYVGGLTVDVRSVEEFDANESALWHELFNAPEMMKGSHR